jgi:hypothetical protein
MRFLLATEGNIHFANWLLEVGDGKNISIDDGTIKLHMFLNITQNLQFFVQDIHSNVPVLLHVEIDTSRIELF